MNKRIALSGMSILTALALIGGATFAFFSDVETSTGNTFTAGDLDLKIDNTSYLNHVLNQRTSWQMSDLTDQLFFNFDDLKPGDEGEDTISLHTTNDSWACADFITTATPDNSCGGSEVGADPNCGIQDTGELQNELNFIFWTDDGDNVLEQGEKVIVSGPASQVLNSKMTLADSSTNNVGGSNGDPLSKSRDYFIGKAWCFGGLTEAAVPQDGSGATGTNGPDSLRGSGVVCDGSQVGNQSETDSLIGDVRFYAEQSRNNGRFLCNPGPSPSPSPSGG